MIKPPPRPQYYHHALLNAGWQWEESAGRMAINPHYLNADDLRLYNIEWVTDMNRYRQWLKYEEYKQGGGKKA